MNTLARMFDEIWLVDFEFSAPPGEVPSVVCMVALEVISERRLRMWKDELEAENSPPFSLDPRSLYVAYYSSAEFGCHLELNWPLPYSVLDLFVEFRNLTNGRQLVSGAGLLGALAGFGLDSIEVAEKAEMRELIARGGPWTAAEKQAVLAYCESDVDALARLLPVMLPHIDLFRALHRGNFMKAAARIEFNGVPIDTAMLNLLRSNWGRIQERLITTIDKDYGVFEGSRFKTDRFVQWLAEHDIPWPTLASGRPDLRDDTFRQMAKAHPEVAALRELRVALSQMRLSELAVGSDGRNRTLLSAFRARTGRNQPSNNRFIFGPAVWLRSLIRPAPGYGLAYIDWSQQEFGIAAALSGDPAMQEAYQSGDPYLAFAKQAGAVPPEATKQTHPGEREQYKACVLAVQYGMGVDSLAKKIGQPPCQARVLLEQHRRTYRRFWEWSDGALNYGMLYGELWTTFGWTIHTDENPNPRFLRNFPMQGNGAEMLRLVCTSMTSTGICVCAPVHDAVLIEAPLEELDATIELAEGQMRTASSLVLNGFELRTDVDTCGTRCRAFSRNSRRRRETVATPRVGEWVGAHRRPPAPSNYL
jgi:hypothetical protein